MDTPAQPRSAFSGAIAGGLAHYRIAAPSLIAAALAAGAIIRQFGLHEAWLAVSAMPLYLVAIVLTFKRLEQSGRTGWWVVLMLTNFSFGAAFFDITPAILINLLPVALAWPAPRTGRAAHSG